MKKLVRFCITLQEAGIGSASHCRKQAVIVGAMLESLQTVAKVVHDDVKTESMDTFAAADGSNDNINVKIESMDDDDIDMNNNNGTFTVAVRGTGSINDAATAAAGVKIESIQDSNNDIDINNSVSSSETVSETAADKEDIDMNDSDSLNETVDRYVFLKDYIWCFLYHVRVS